MRGLWHPILVICMIFLVPIVPFVLFGDAFDEQVGQWLDQGPSDILVGLMTVGVLAGDILLPVPSSLVSTFAGARLGIVPAAIASWLGLTAGGVIGFYLARRFGRPWAERYSSAQDIEKIDRMSGRYGRAVLVIARALPVLAEASVLVLGISQLTWRQFLPPLALSNLGIAIVYSALGSWARGEEQLPLALAASIALPVAAAAIARVIWR